MYEVVVAKLLDACQEQKLATSHFGSSELPDRNQRMRCQEKETQCHMHLSQYDFIWERSREELQF